jgi:transcriptional regulator with XRE-family HTH domain
MAGRLGIGSKRLGSYEDGRARPKIEDLVMISRKLRYKTIDAFLRKNECSTVESEIENAYYQLPADKREIVDFILYNQK